MTEEFSQNFQSYNSQLRNIAEVLFGFVHLFLLSWGCNGMIRQEELVFRRAQWSEQRGKVSQIRALSILLQKTGRFTALPL